MQFVAGCRLRLLFRSYLIFFGVLRMCQSVSFFCGVHTLTETKSVCPTFISICYTARAHWKKKDIENGCVRVYVIFVAEYRTWAPHRLTGNNHKSNRTRPASDRKSKKCFLCRAQIRFWIVRRAVSFRYGRQSKHTSSWPCFDHSGILWKDKFRWESRVLSLRIVSNKTKKKHFQEDFEMEWANIDRATSCAAEKRKLSPAHACNRQNRDDQ